jgi:hypothetical protein
LSTVLYGLSIRGRPLALVVGTYLSTTGRPGKFQEAPPSLVERKT